MNYKKTYNDLIIYSKNKLRKKLKIDDLNYVYYEITPWRLLS